MAPGPFWCIHVHFSGNPGRIPKSYLPSPPQLTARTGRRPGPRSGAKRDHPTFCGRPLQGPAMDPAADIPPPTTKRCTKCGREKPVSEFGFRGGKRRRRSAWCRDCTRQYHLEWTWRNIERVRIQTRVAYLPPRGRDRKGPLHKRRARAMVHWAVRLGVLKRKETCEQCGIPAARRPLQAHHTDYSRPARGHLALHAVPRKSAQEILGAPGARKTGCYHIFGSPRRGRMCSSHGRTCPAKPWRSRKPVEAWRNSFISSVSVF